MVRKRVKNRTWEDLLEELEDKIIRQLPQRVWVYYEDEKPLVHVLIRNISNRILGIVRNIPLNDRNTNAVELLFADIWRLVFVYGDSEALNADMRAVPAIHKLRKLHQFADPARERLFLQATARHFRENKSSKLKRGYSWEKALEDENATAKLIPEKEFDDMFQQIVTHFRSWRHKNKISSMDEKAFEQFRKRRESELWFTPVSPK